MRLGLTFLLAGAVLGEDLTATDCNSIKKETQCMSASENGEACSWCQSAAVGNTCFKESDAQTLPTDVFQCKYQGFKDLLATDCNSIKKETQCMSASENGEACSWCQSAAVGNTCFKESDAETLPTDVFQCKYQSNWIMDLVDQAREFFGF
jgi:cellobiose phosphorylase